MEEKQVLYKINDFAKMVGITPKTLRLYDELNLLKPFFIDKTTHYRFYHISQYKTITLILQLKMVGFTLHEINDYLHNSFNIKNKILALQEKKEIIETMLIGLYFLEKNDCNYFAYLKTESSLNVLNKEVKVKHFRDLIPIFKEFSSEIIDRHIRFSVPEYCVIEFLDGSYKEENIKAMLSIGIIPNYKTKFFSTSMQQYIATIHKGTYETIKEAYDFLDEYIIVHNLEKVGNPSERYIENYYLKASEEEYLTEVRYPVKIKDS